MPEIMETISRKITVNKDSHIKDIRNVFNLFYPFLTIEFGSNSKGIFSLNWYKIDPEINVSEITKFLMPIKLDLNEERTVAEVEKDFKELLGLQIKVCRKSGNVWNEISVTDSWTLKSQNIAGQFISTEMTGT